MVREGGEGYVIIEVEAERFAVALRGVLLAFVGELLGDLAQIGVDQGVEALPPDGRKLAILVTYDGFDVGGCRVRSA